MVAATCSKIIIVATNVVFMIFGIALLSIGIIFKVGWDDVRDAFSDDITKEDFDLQTAGDGAGISAIVFGCFILILAGIGCLGACCQNKCLLGTYAAITIVLVIIQVAIISFVAVKGKDAEDVLEDALHDTLKDYDELSSTDVSKSWSAIFKMGECCAVTNLTDFQKDPFKAATKLRQEAGVTGKSIPITCCRGVDYEDSLNKDVFKDKKACLDGPTKTNAYTEGCYQKIKDWINDNKRIIIGVGAGVLIFELILSIMAFFLCCRSED